MENKRNSNIEILRIIAMFLIVWHHSGYVNSEALGDTLTYNSIVIRFSYFLGKIGVNIFFLITGYYLCKGKFKKKKLISILATTEFYGIIVVIISYLSTNIKLGSNFIFNFPLVSSMYWFATDYIIIYILSPYLNILVKNLPKDKFKKMLITLLIIWCIIPNVFGIMGATIGCLFEFTQLGWGIIMYFLGAYYRNYDIKIFKKTKNNIIILLISFVLSITEIVIFSIFKNSLKTIQLNDMNSYINNANNILIIIPSITLFSIFINMKPRHNGYINLLASSMFGVYLIHSNVVMDYLRKYVFQIPIKLINTRTPLTLTISYSFNVIFICCIIEFIRIVFIRIIKEIIKKMQKSKKI